MRGEERHLGFLQGLGSRVLEGRQVRGGRVLEGRQVRGGRVLEGRQMRGGRDLEGRWVRGGRVMEGRQAKGRQERRLLQVTVPGGGGVQGSLVACMLTR